MGPEQIGLLFGTSVIGGIAIYGAFVGVEKVREAVEKRRERRTKAAQEQPQQPTRTRRA